jgi:hypothetical protein
MRFLQQKVAEQELSKQCSKFLEIYGEQGQWLPLEAKENYSKQAMAKDCTSV